MRAIKKENTTLKNMLSKNYASPDLDKRVLGEVVDLFTNEIKMDGTKASKDLLGITYEYCIAQFASYEGTKGSEFYTPSSIVKTIVFILKLFNNYRVYNLNYGTRVIITAEVNSSMKSRILKLLPKLKINEIDSLYVA